MRNGLIISAVLCAALALSACSAKKAIPDLSGMGEITVISREEGSGTRDEFENIIGTGADGTDKIALSAAEVSEMVSSVEGAIGYTAYTAAASENVKAVSVNGIALNEENISNGKYPLYRSYYLAYNGELSAAQTDFLAYIMSAGQAIADDECVAVKKSTGFLSDKSSGNIKICGSKKLCQYMDIERKYVFRNISPIDLSFVFELQDNLRQKSELFYTKRIPQRSVQFIDGKPILEQIKEGDKLLAYPFDSIKPFLNMLHEAASDKDVVSIKMTLYRVAKNSEVVNALIEAAENGKNVLVLVELKARFDEENNIEWSRRLEAAGCTVIYGLNGFKVHSKLCLITKSINGNPEYITQIGTGNYNEKTSRIYTDLSLMTADSTIGRNANDVFNALASDTTVKSSEALLVAPNCLQNRIIEMIDEQIVLAQNGEEAYIGVKINSLTDKTIIDELIKASKAGVKIELAVRGICCLIPGVSGETENIRVISVVGRFLEHSRIYIFGKGEAAKVYIASADFMTRNTLRRVEVAAPVYDASIKEHIISMYNCIMADNVQARELNNEGVYVRVKNNNEKLNSQELFYDMAYEQAQGTAMLYGK